MKCRDNCGACCIALSISSPIPGMPHGKPGGVRCINLNEYMKCTVYDSRPRACSEFSPSDEYCGASREEALTILGQLEEITK